MYGTTLRANTAVQKGQRPQHGRSSDDPRPARPPDEDQSDIQSLSFRRGDINTNLWLPSVPGKIFG